MGIGQLKADKQGLGARDEQEKSRVQDVQNAQAFVVDRHYPSVKPLEEGTELRCGSARLDRRDDWKCVIAHIRILSSLQCFEVSSNLVQLLIAKLHCGHKRSAFERIGGFKPLAEIRRRVVHRYATGAELPDGVVPLLVPAAGGDDVVAAVPVVTGPTVVVPVAAVPEIV